MLKYKISIYKFVGRRCVLVRIHRCCCMLRGRRNRIVIQMLPCNVRNDCPLSVCAIICSTDVVVLSTLIIVISTRPTALGYARTRLIHHVRLYYDPSKSSVARGRYSEVALQPCMSILNQTCHLCGMGYDQVHHGKFLPQKVSVVLMVGLPATPASYGFQTSPDIVPSRRTNSWSVVYFASVSVQVSRICQTTS